VDPAELVGRWSVSGTGLTFDPYGFELRDGADQRSGSWRADPCGLFVAHVTTAGLPDPPWLAAAIAFTTDGADVVLLDAAGAVVARLSPAPGPPREPGGPAGWFGPTTPLPDGLEPAARSRLIGRWVPVDQEWAARAPRPAHALLAADGTWTSTNGCTGANGRWASGPDGMFLATDCPVALMACDGMVNVPGWLALAARAGFDGATLVLFDMDGREKGRLMRP
jgi:hypothetical protein